MTVRVLAMVALAVLAVGAQGSYDAALAKKLKADQYGMRTYVMAFLKAGPNRNRSREEAQKLQQAHMANINRLAAEGKLVLAGPFADDGPLRGVYIFDVATVAEAEALTRTDPAIQAGSLVMELHPWYGSAALMMVNEVHGKIEQKQP
ncbi:MAG TPA: YciI family protein [Vicinamibacterales bacterium]